ncbi:glycosyltransferase [Lentzea sp. PSKA42]|uniref:Glycosyltransferase n=1 Tax=Lentzea indica TaxID=2604800 RepID=A0ABX1FV93_9PSEU|nr:glycosyltransferase [Lentzea indica]NKE62958.1 glycosyltransferase [Lentzea indica]
MTGYTVIIPTLGRESLDVVVNAIRHGDGPPPDEIIVVYDEFGRGPAAARNAGWRRAASEWVVFVDDDVVPPPDWKRQLTKDLAAAGNDVAASQARIEVPLPRDRRPTDWERNTAGLAEAKWITADMAYRRSVLLETGGFDERFPRAYREDADLALRVMDLGYRVVRGDRVTTHPVRRTGFFTSVKQQRGNADDALMRKLHGPRWREKIGGRRGKLREHALTTFLAAVALLCGLSGKRRAAAAAVLGWAALTARFAAQRIAPGPRTAPEIVRMIVTSAAIPPAACLHRARGELRVRA